MDFLCRKGLLLFAFSIPLALLPLCARTLTFDEEKCRIDVPDTWTEKAVPESRASYFNADKTKFVAVRIVQVGQKTTFDNPAFLQSYEDQIVASGATISGQQQLPLAGVDAREIDSTVPTRAGTIFNRLTVALANGFAYSVAVSDVGSKPSEDAELSAITKSFGFIGAPQPHHKANPMDSPLAYVIIFFGILGLVSAMKYWPRKKS